MTDPLPFSHTINVRTLPRKGRREDARPEGDVLEATARHLGVDSVQDARFDAEVTPWKRDGLKLEGRVRATVRQPCVVTLEPVETQIDEPFETFLVPEGSRLAVPREGDAELLLDAEGDDPPETFSGDTIDLAAIWLEFLALAIDPFPRAKGARMPEIAADETPSPFAALAALKAANDG